MEVINASDILMDYGNYCYKGSSGDSIVLGTIDKSSIMSKFVYSISPKSKVFISQSSSFPSSELSRTPNIDIKRVINMNKADVVVTDDFPNNYIEFKSGFYYKCTLSSDEIVEYFSPDDYDLNMVNNRVTSRSEYSNRKVISIEKIDATLVDRNEKSVVIWAHPGNLITTNILNEYVDSFLDDLDTETLNSIDELIGSDSKDIVNMGLKLLSKYKFQGHRFQITAMLRDKHSRIKGYGLLHTSTVKYIFSKVEIDVTDDYETFLCNAYRISSNTDPEKSLIRDKIIERIQYRLDSYYREIVKDANITVIIE